MVGQAVHGCNHFHRGEVFFQIGQLLERLAFVVLLLGKAKLFLLRQQWRHGLDTGQSDLGFRSGVFRSLFAAREIDLQHLFVPGLGLLELELGLRDVVLVPLQHDLFSFVGQVFILVHFRELFEFVLSRFQKERDVLDLLIRRFNLERLVGF